jgi:RHS repeat-associated protein
VPLIAKTSWVAHLFAPLFLAKGGDSALHFLSISCSRGEFPYLSAPHPSRTPLRGRVRRFFSPAVIPPRDNIPATNMIADGSNTYFGVYPERSRSAPFAPRKILRGNSENRLAQVDGAFGTCSTATACYVYDALGRRVEKTVAGKPTDYIFDLSGNVLNEYNNVCAPICQAVDYFYLNGQLVGQYKNGVTYWFHADHLGSKRLVTGLNQAVVQNLDYLPFGELNSTDSHISSHEFTGDERDPETSLDAPSASRMGLRDHTQFRQYSSQLARWISPDPAGLAAVDPSNPQSWNRYAYVLNNPMNLVDPFGLDPNDGCTWNPEKQELTCPSPPPEPTGPVGGGGDTPSPWQCFDIVLDGIFVGNSCDGSPPRHGLRRSDFGGGSTIGPATDWSQTKQAMCAAQAVKATVGGLVMKKEIDAALSPILGALIKYKVRSGQAQLPSEQREVSTVLPRIARFSTRSELPFEQRDGSFLTTRLRGQRNSWARPHWLHMPPLLHRTVVRRTKHAWQTEEK